MTEKEVVIRVEGLSKKFCKDLKRSLYYGFRDILKLGRGNTDDLRKDEFWAVSDISFELRKGDCLGLIGHNGAGKSTLLKILNGLISPDKGKVTIHGRVGALIELGAGFNPILTGRENIYNNGAVLGFSKKEVDQKIDEIIEFSEIEEFIDMPVQNYSSGMKVRLGFAVAANLEPDLLLIDEVLAVGDVGFRIKCYNKIAALLDDTAIIFVSHAMPQLAKISNIIQVLEKGASTYYGRDISEGIETYYNLFPGEKRIDVGSTIHVDSIGINGLPALEKEIQCKHGSPLDIDLEVSTDETFERIRIVAQFIDKDMKPVAKCFSEHIPLHKGIKTHIKLHLDKNEFSIGKFSIGLLFLAFNEQDVMTRQIRRYEAITTIVMSGLSIFSHAPFQLIGEWEVSAPTDQYEDIEEIERTE